MGSGTLQIALAGMVAGLVAGMVMSLVMMGSSKKSGLSIWHMPNLIAATWLGPDARGERFRGKVTFVGFVTHMATSALMGIIFPFWTGDPRTWGLAVLLGIIYAVASYPLVGHFVMSWLNPHFLKETNGLYMTIGHLIFGVVLGLCYPWLLGVFG